MSENKDHFGLWLGEFKFANDRWRAHLQFYKAIERCAPEVLRALHEEVLPLIHGRRTAQPRNDATLLHRGKNNSELLIDELEYDYIASGVPAAIRKWAERFHLFEQRHETVGLRRRKRSTSADSVEESDEAWREFRRSPIAEAFGDKWVFPTASATLERWAKHKGKQLEKLEWEFPLLGSLSEILQWPASLALSIRGWKLLTETRVEAEKRMLKEAHDKIKEYLQLREQKAREKDMDQRPKTWEIDHFEWLVRYQVQGWSHNKIGKEYHRSRPAVENGVSVAAKLVIGPYAKRWLRPPGKAGRPRKECVD